jgi:hypothetical protein
MKNVDTSKVWRGKRKPEKLEMKGFSTHQSSKTAKKEKIEIPEKSRKPINVTKKPSNRETTQPRNHDTTVSRYHATIIELVRKAAKELGKEAATHRFTINEKKALADLIYSYKNKGVRTSENEVTRIAVNFIINDYKEYGENSVLDRTLKALNQ